MPTSTAQFPADTYYNLVHTLRHTLPPPLTDNAEGLARRGQSAINAAEADIVVDRYAILEVKAKR